MILVCTLGGIPNVLIDGVVTRHEVAPSNEAGQSTLTLTGEDLTVLMDVIEIPIMRYPGMPIVARLNLLAREVRGVRHRSSGHSAAVPRCPDTNGQIPSQTGSDLAYIKKMADADRLHLLSRARSRAGHQHLLLRPRHPHSHSAACAQRQHGRELQRRKAHLQPRWPGEEGRHHDDHGSDHRQDPDPDSGAEHQPPAPAARRDAHAADENLVSARRRQLNSIQAIALALAKTGDTGEAISGSGTLNVIRYGICAARQLLVGVRGAGRAYDGMYYVSTVTHNIKRGEYKQSFTLSRDGTGLA